MATSNKDVGLVVSLVLSVVSLVLLFGVTWYFQSSLDLLQQVEYVRELLFKLQEQCSVKLFTTKPLCYSYGSTTILCYTCYIQINICIYTYILRYSYIGWKWLRLTVEVTGLVGAIVGAAVMLDDSGALLVVPSINSSVTPPNMETPPTGGFPFGLCTPHGNI